MRKLLLTTLLFGVWAGTARADISTGLRDAMIDEGNAIAADYGWPLVDLINTHGDSRRGYGTLVLLTVYKPGEYTASFDIEVRAARCGPGWIAVRTPLGGDRCHRPGVVAWWWRWPTAR